MKVLETVNGSMSLLWLPGLVALELKEVYWEILKELHAIQSGLF